MAAVDLLDPMMDLTRRLPPSKIESTLDVLCALAPEYADDLLGSVDQPLKILRDETQGRDFLACDYNRDGESFRSPWSNEYQPPIEDPQKPAESLRLLEVSMNEAFDTYREMYFEGGVSSVFLWNVDEDKDKFAGVVLLKKVLPSSPTTPSGSWDSIHVFEAHERGRTVSYKLTSTVMLELVAGTEVDPKGGSVELAGSLTRQTEQDNCPLSSPTSHIPNVGRMIEDMEIKLRNLLGEVYFGKTKDVVNDVRSFAGLEMKRNEDALRRELMASMRR
ncbi:f-actin capping protein beta subunit [Phaffia rhodozyma]|uniref:F-actin-capping protein subunit beta n=1 Tax=Phaffia rhodozyma TaxID=264483 RepID=A0A0F7SIY7_PHARH|nr:f-actin capping protein beta subunit [Phaffia rhodozyma]